MPDDHIKLIWQAKDKVKDALKLGIKEHIDKAFDVLFDVFQKYYPEKTNDGDLAYLQLVSIQK